MALSPKEFFKHLAETKEAASRLEGEKNPKKVKYVDINENTFYLEPETHKALYPIVSRVVSSYQRKILNYCTANDLSLVDAIRDMRSTFESDVQAALEKSNFVVDNVELHAAATTTLKCRSLMDRNNTYACKPFMMPGRLIKYRIFAVIK